MYFLLLKTIPQSITAEPEQLHAIMKEFHHKIVKEIRAGEIEFKEIVGYELLPKLYFMEDKLSEAKITPLTSFRKFKERLHEEVKAGLTRFDHIELEYQKGPVRTRDHEEEEREAYC